MSEDVDTRHGAGENAAMRSQPDRDAVTLSIFTTLLLFALVLAIGAVPMALVNRFFGEGAALEVLGYLVLVCASVVAFSHLWRHRRP